QRLERLVVDPADEPDVVVAGHGGAYAAVQPDRPRHRHLPLDPALCRELDAAEQTDQGGLAGAVAAEHSELVAGHHRKRNVAENPVIAVTGFRVIVLADPGGGDHQRKGIKPATRAVTLR